MIDNEAIKTIKADAIDAFRNDIMNRFIDLCMGNDYNKVNLLTIGDTIDHIYDLHIDNIMSNSNDDLALINRQRAEIEKIYNLAEQDNKKLYETLDYRAEKITELESEIERLTTLAELGNMRANDYRATRDKLKSANTEIERLKEQLEEYPFKCKVGNNSEIHSKSIQDYDRLIDDIQAEAVKEFAERLCEDRLSNDPVVIAVKVELKEMVGEG